MSGAPDRLDVIRERLRVFVEERDWGQFHDPKNLAMMIASEAGELLSELRWVRNDEADWEVSKERKHERVEAEVADVGIALLLFCDRARIDLLAAMERKIALNALKYPAHLARGRAERPDQA